MPDDTYALIAALRAAEYPPDKIAELDALIAAGGETPAGVLAVLNNAQLPLDLRETACWAIFQLQYKPALPVLGRIMEDGTHPLWWWAYRIVGTLYDQRTAPRLLRQAQHLTDVEQRKGLLIQLGHVLDGTHGPRLRNIVAEVSAILTNPDDNPSVRGAAAEALGDIGAPEAFEPLIAALADPAPEVRLHAAFALGDLGDLRAIPALEHLAATDEAVIPNWGAVAQQARDALTTLQRQSQPDTDLSPDSSP